MKHTIHYISDIKYFSRATGKYTTKVNAIKAHISYIEKSAEFILGSKKIILDVAKNIDTQANSRVAMKLCVALPNDLSEQEKIEWAAKTRDFFSAQLNIPATNFLVALHSRHRLQNELGTQNIHLHILANTQTSANKKIRLNPKDLSAMHKNWDTFLASQGYTIKKEKPGASIGKIGWQNLKDPVIKSRYKAYIQAQKQIQMIEENINNAITKTGRSEILRKALTSIPHKEKTKQDNTNTILPPVLPSLDFST